MDSSSYYLFTALILYTSPRYGLNKRISDTQYEEKGI